MSSGGAKGRCRANDSFHGIFFLILNSVCPSGAGKVQMDRWMELKVKLSKAKR